MLDAVVIGGGAAGLAAAAELARAKASFVLLEARARLGGRAWTERAGRHPVELGAEFVHGRPEPALRELRRAGLHYRPVRESGDGGYWKELDDALGRLRAAKRDRPFLGAIRSVRGLSADAVEAAVSFVRGFHAADPARIGALEVAEETTQGAAESYRIPEGYGALIAALAKRSPARSLVLNAAVDRVRWVQGRVAVDSGGRTFDAAAAIVTLPLGVLRAGSVRFVPALPARKRGALELLEMGVVAKVGLLFKRAAWREVERAAAGRFMRDERGPFSVYWPASPLPTPLITAWCGGPEARRLCAGGKRAAVDEAVSGFARVAGLDERFVRRGLARAYFHDWLADPYARGAYSYARPGGLPARAELGRPVAGTLFFAGEACALGGASGTVAGALETGRAAALMLLRATGSRARPSSGRTAGRRSPGTDPRRRRARRRSPAPA
jgi:monoamine oxidase